MHRQGARVGADSWIVFDKSRRSFTVVSKV